MTKIDNQLPTGYVKSKTRGGFTSHNGPFFHKVDGESFWHALQIRAYHCNSGKHLHGGMAASFADGLLSTAVWHACHVRGLTISLNCSYLGRAKVGDWLEGTAALTGHCDQFAYALGEARVNKELVLSASGVFRLLKEV